MIRRQNLRIGYSARNKKLELMVIAAIVPIFAVSFYAFQPIAAAPAYRVAPNAAATPRRVKKNIAVGDVNGDGPDAVIRSKGKRKLKPASSGSNGAVLAPDKAKARTETVNNNETLRTNRRLNYSGAQDGSGTDNANIRRKRTTHGVVTDNWDPDKLGKTKSNRASTVATAGNGQGIRRKGPTKGKHKRYRK